MYIERDDEEWETCVKPALLKFCVDLDKNMKESKEEDTAEAEGEERID